MLTNPDDIRDIQGLKDWRSYADSLSRRKDPQPRWTPTFVAARDWVTIKVRNVTSSTVLKWSPMHLEGLDDPADPDTSNIYDQPTGMLHPDRLWKASFGKVVGGTDFKYGPTHAVIIQDLAPQAIGTAVIKGVVPGLISYPPSGYMSSTDNYTPARVVPAAKQGIPGGFIIPWADVSNGAQLGDNNSQVLYSWATPSNKTWGLINLNIGNYPFLQSDLTAQWGMDHATFKQNLTLNASNLLPLPCFQNTAISGPLWKPATGSTGIVFNRPCSAFLDWNFHWQPNAATGQLVPGRVDPLYAYQPQTWELWVKTFPTIGTGINLKIADGGTDGSYGVTSSMVYKRQLYSSRIIVTASGFNSAFPQRLELQAKGTGVLQNINVHMQAIQWGNYPVDYNGTTLTPPTSGNGGGGLPEA